MIGESTNERNTVFVWVDTDKFWVAYNVWNLFEA